MKRRSLTQILFSWSVLMLGIITVSLGYLLLQLQLSQFSNHWEQRISFENEALKHDIEFHLNNGATAMVEAHINRMSQDPSLVYMAIISANAEQVYFSTRRTDLLRGLDYRLSSYSLNTGIRKPQIQRHRSEFYALYPIDMPGRSNQSTNGWLFAHYDAATDYEQMLRSVVRKIALIAALAIAYLAIQTQIIRRHIFGPVRRLIVLTEALREGRYVTVRQDESTDEIGRLEDAFNDLSEHLEATTASIDQHQALTDAFTTAFPDVGLTVSSTGVISGRFGYPKSRISRLNEDLIGTPFTAWLNLAATDIIEKARDRALKNNELVIADFSHDDLFLESRMIPMGDGNKAEFQLMWLIRDISEVKRKQQLIEYQANYDPLTELANRRMALLELEKYITRAKANGSWGAVLFIDLDHFKNINDSLGHPIGDRLLVEAARRLSHTASDKDVIARLGGDEFLIIMDTEYQDEADAENQALALGNQLLEAIRLPFSIDINKFHLTASIGIAVFPVSECGANDLIRQADTAMYWAKHQGRSRICLYNHRMQEETRERLHLFNDLYQAIRDNGFTLVYQPQHIDRGEVTGA
ncbi:MAG: diguanylate cyclase [Thalassolituus sp.]